ncbi:MAG: TonB-dependent receptor plug domain-containing protein [Filimonas sp.]|nr:TonB-dependent receptor plug domain-containing protein [Filimonas sp.]
MSAIFIYFVKVCISSGLFWLYFLIALRNKPFHAYNRFYLLFSTGASLLIPLVNMNWLVWESASPGALQFTRVWHPSEGAIPVFTVEASSGINWQLIMIIVLAVIALVAIAVVLLRIRKLYSIRGQYPVTAIEDFYFINTDIQHAPFSFLNNLFWRKDLAMDDEQGKMIMQHELTHIAQKHSVDKLFMQLLLCFFWMNPFFWIIRKELSMVHEFIADDRSVENKDVSAFAAMLLHVQIGKNMYAPAQPFNYSPIKRRLLMLTRSAVTKYSYARRFMAVPLLLVVVLLSAFKVQQKSMQAAAVREERKQEVVVAATPAVEAFLQPHSDEDTTKAQKKNNTVFITGEGKTIAITPTTDKLVLRGISGAAKGPAMYVVDGVEVDATAFQAISPSDIQSVTILKNTTAIAMYGEKAADGVIAIVTKKDGTTSKAVVELKRTANDVTATFVGGDDAWRNFLSENIHRATPVEKGAKAGKYTVILDFQVAADGTISDIRVQSNPGYGTGEEAARVMSLSPKWNPAALGGTAVLSRQKQAITFIVE